ncbi:MAG: phosphoribosyltransferase [bacterium]
MIQFKNRQDAGKKLAKKLLTYKNNPKAIVIGLPRGGVVVAYEIAQILELPLDIVVPRKLGAPFNPELAIGAVTEDGSIILDHQIINILGISKTEITEIIEKEKKEAERRLQIYRKNRPPLNLKNQIVILVDDGIATGSTMLAAIKSVQVHGAQSIIIAIPIGPTETIAKIKNMVDSVVVLDTPPNFMAIGIYYKSFTQTTDEEVITLLTDHHVF